MWEITNNNCFISYKYQNSQRRYYANCNRTVYIPCDNEWPFVNIQLVFEISTGIVLKTKVFLKIS